MFISTGVPSGTLGSTSQAVFTLVRLHLNLPGGESQGPFSCFYVVSCLKHRCFTQTLAPLPGVWLLTAVVWQLQPHASQDSPRQGGARWYTGLGHFSPAPGFSASPLLGAPTGCQ